ncbi:hypothetical protein F0562_017846 [Nyssa sinensis]|uniref:Transcription repressor n=1 Tax=Nyssa sinensis TaxID=561372 RepID=A0A5J4ZI17_9ASTE|nr:hypothetical protein F0562_017846 [Nyssa sinensis]
MGNYRFRLSDMIPNAWFYKLKDMGRTRKQNTIHPTKKKQPPTSSSSTAAASTQPPEPKQSHLSHQRKSYYFTRELTPPPTSDSTFYNNSPRSTKASDTHFPADPPRKSSNNRRSTRRNRSSPRLVTSTATVSAGCSCRATIQSVWTKPDTTSEEYPNSPLDSSSDLESLLPECGSDRGLPADSFDGMVSWSSSCHCRLNNDIIIDMDDKPFNGQFDGFERIGEVELPPIITKQPFKFNDAINDMKKKKKKKKKDESNESTTITRSSAKFEERNANGSLFVKVVKENTISNSKEQRTSPVRRFSANSPGLKLRTNSPRIASRKIQAHGRKSVSSTTSSGSRRSTSGTFAVVKSSSDPQTDFRDSMVEMILENNIRASKDLEELLACYLSLNSVEHHDVIINAFKQIWFCPCSIAYYCAFPMLSSVFL